MIAFFLKQTNKIHEFFHDWQVKSPIFICDWLIKLIICFGQNYAIFFKISMLFFFLQSVIYKICNCHEWLIAEFQNIFLWLISEICKLLLQLIEMHITFSFCSKWFTKIAIFMNDWQLNFKMFFCDWFFL